MAESGPRRAAAVRGARVAFDEVPLIDIAPLGRTDEASKRATVREIAAACRNVGFFYIVNHGVPSSLVAEMLAQARLFFALPEAEKMKVHIARSPIALYPRGYFRLEEETLVHVGPTDAGERVAAERYAKTAHADAGGDLKEGYDFAKEVAPDDPVVLAGNPFHGPNQWPRDRPDFRRVVGRYYDAMIEVGFTLCRAFALGLDLPEDFFARRLHNPMGIYRMLHYPPQAGDAAAPRLGTAAHTDYGLVAMLAQDEIGGLEVRNSAGDWVAAPPIAGTFVCNLGEAMARWTNDAFAATLHRVVNTSGRDRYSIPFFFDPDYDAEVRCLDVCTGPDNPPRYPPTTMGRILSERRKQGYGY